MLSFFKNIFGFEEKPAKVTQKKENPYKIIHITGLPGSGKTTLGKKIAKKIPNTIVIDTDDIDDPNQIKLLRKFSLKKRKDFSTIETELEKLNREAIKKIVKENRNTKHIIFVGFLHWGMAEYIIPKLDMKFCIKIDAETLWRQYMLRTMGYIKKHRKKIQALLKSKMDPRRIRGFFLSEFGLRKGFDCEGIEDVKNAIRSIKTYAKDENYVYQTSDKIFKTIEKKLL